MKRIKALAVILITVLLSGVLGGCGINLKDILVQPDKEYGDFLYNTFEKSEYLEAYATISGLTEQGQQKEVLVVPESINGLPVRGLYKRSALWGGQSVEWHSDNLKVLYLYNNIISETRFYCKNHKKTIFISCALACSSNASGMEKSKIPSSGSTSSQLTGRSNVFI